MPFMFKLSQRLARFRCAVPLLATATVAACQKPGSVTAPLGPGAPLVQVIVSPDSIILDPAQQMRFAAYGRSASGDSAAVTVNWSATGGSITPQGLFTADTTSGDFLVRAFSPALTLSGSSRVHRGSRDPGFGEHAHRADGAAHGHTAGRRRQSVERAGGDLDEQRRGRGHGE